jgi:FkbM family methyltransferase
MKHFLLKTLPFNKHLYNFCKSYVEKHDGDCDGDIATNGELRVMKHFLSGCSVVFDVGAHTGEWTRLALSINPGLIIHCFEPSRDNFDHLIRNVSSPNVTCNPFGLSSENGERPLFIFRSAPGLHSLYQRRGLEDGWGLKTPRETETVMLDTLENYCAQRQIGRIDFLKIDVEGHELEVFKGGRSLFEDDRVGMIQFEYGGCNIDSKVLLKDIFEFFAGMNYNFYKIFPNRLKRFRRYDQRLENFKYQNWILISQKSETIPADREPEAIAPEKSVMERSRLVARETALVNDLRNEILIMPEPKVETDSAAESAWVANRVRLRRCILEEDPWEFLTWDVVTGSMFVGNRPFIESELRYLMGRPDWTHTWEDILEEDHAGRPKPYKGYRRSSGNRIHQAYHLARFEQETGLSVSRYPLIVEFGGGYGSLCRLIHKLGFNGRYIIFDLPELVALQKYYLGSLAMPLIEAKDVPSGRRGILCTSDLNVLGTVTRQEAQAGLFIATWSLSETDPALREKVMTLPAIDAASAYLIAYQSDFEGVDNPRFFDAWRARKPGIRWVHSEIAHMPGNYYLFGTAKTS